MRIKELAEATGVDVDTIRYYEKQGLLPEPARQDNGYRNYTETHLVQLNFIRHCRSLGIGLPEVRILRSFQARPELACEEINQLIDRQIGRIHQQVETLRLLERQLHALRDTCHATQSASECGIMRNLAQAAEGDGCSCHQTNHANQP